MIGTTAAIILGLTAAANAGTQIYTAKKQSESSDKAAEAQLKASNKQAELMAQQYQTQQMRLAPYQDIGNMGAQNLASMLRGPQYPAFTPGMAPVSMASLGPQQPAQPWGVQNIPASILNAQRPTQIAPGVPQGGMSLADIMRSRG